MNHLETLTRDRAIFIDNSALELLCTCPRAYEYSQLVRRVTASPRPALSFGAIIHEALALRYRTDPHLENPATRDAMREFIRQGFSKVNIPDDEYRNLDYAEQIINAYNYTYEKEPWDVLKIEVPGSNSAPLVELPFAIILGEIQTVNGSVSVIYKGKIDLGVERNRGLWVVDHKTSSVMGDTFYADLAVSPQQLGYCWAIWRCLERLPVGFTINAIASRRPTKTGKGIEFNRHDVFINEPQLLEWEFNTLALVEELVWHASRGYMPMKKKWCVGKYGRCQYYDVCSLPENQRGVMLSSGLFIDNTWDPLNKEGAE